jgi:membrane protein
MSSFQIDHLIYLVVTGFLVGLLARFFHPGRDPMGFFFTTFLGITGAVIAGYAGQYLRWIRIGQPSGYIASILGAILVLILVNAVSRR